MKHKTENRNFCSCKPLTFYLNLLKHAKCHQVDERQKEVQDRDTTRLDCSGCQEGMTRSVQASLPPPPNQYRQKQELWRASDMRVNVKHRTDGQSTVQTGISNAAWSKLPVDEISGEGIDPASSEAADSEAQNLHKTADFE